MSNTGYKLADGTNSKEYDIGDKFKVINHAALKGEVVELVVDDDSSSPVFKANDKQIYCMYWDGLQHHKEENNVDIISIDMNVLTDVEKAVLLEWSKRKPKVEIEILGVNVLVREEPIKIGDGLDGDFYFYIETNDTDGYYKRRYSDKAFDHIVIKRGLAFRYEDDAKAVATALGWYEIGE